MANGGSPTTSTTVTAGPASRNQDAFRRLLREADICIKGGKLAQASMHLMEAKRMDSTNPYILAFEERINMLQKDPEKLENIAATHTPIPPPVVEVPPAPTPGIVEVSMTEVEIRERLREEIESEFKARFMAELQQQEANAMHLLEQERTQLQLERESLQTEFDRRLAETQQQMQEAFQLRFDQEMAALEQGLRSRAQSEQSALEGNIQTQLASHYEEELRRLHTQLGEERDQLLEQERQAFALREKAAKEQSDRQLLEAIRKTEQVFQQQSAQQQQLQEQQLRAELAQQLELALAAERDSVHAEFATMRTALEEEFRSEQARLEQEYHSRFQAELAALRQQDEVSFEQRRQELFVEMEAEMRERFAAELLLERERLTAEAEAAIEVERARLQKEREEMVSHQNEHLRLIRADLRREMEETFLRRLEKISKEYDHKMEILGAVVPKTPEEAIKLYREKMMVFYKNGLPTVEAAKSIMALKEILDLTFDTHFAVESDVRLALYVASVERKMLNGELNPGNIKMLETLKGQFAITPEESARLEPYILSSFQRFAVKGRICLVDDDPALLSLLEGELTSKGYHVVSSLAVEEAVEKLATTSVDLILSDIKFPEGEPDGFKFFSMVQEQPHLRKLPFVFMSSLQDGVIVRSGMQLGIDDYITKPLDTDMLFAIIEGKLKRYRRLQAV